MKTSFQKFMENTLQGKSIRLGVEEIKEFQDNIKDNRGALNHANTLKNTIEDDIEKLKNNLRIFRNLASGINNNVTAFDNKYAALEKSYKEKAAFLGINYKDIPNWKPMEATYDAYMIDTMDVINTQFELSTLK